MSGKTLALYLGTAVLTAVLAVAPHAWKGSFEPPSVLAAGAKDEAMAKAAHALGSLSAARASTSARQNASLNAMVGYIEAYETEMKAALRLKDLARQLTAIKVARENLALTANKQLTPAAITRVDNLIGLPESPAALGTTGR